MKKNSQIIKNLILLTFCFGLNISCNNSQIKTKSNIQFVESSGIHNDQLKEKAAKLNEFYNDKNCKEFINAFPNTFQEFNQLYGYEDGKGGNILFSKPEHITYFFDCSEIADKAKLNKAIEIGIDGKWDADNIGEFQNSTYEIVRKYPDETKKSWMICLIKKRLHFGFFFLTDRIRAIRKMSVILNY